MAMKTEDRGRARGFGCNSAPRFRVSTKLEGTGVMLDLSTGGCRIESGDVEPAFSLEFCVSMCQTRMAAHDRGGQRAVGGAARYSGWPSFGSRSLSKRVWIR